MLALLLLLTLFVTDHTCFAADPQPKGKNTPETALEEGCEVGPSGRIASYFPVGELFHPSLASPKEPRTHLIWQRMNLEWASFNAGSVAFGELFGLVRWPGWGENDAWQLSVSGGVQSLFNLKHLDSLELINSDFIIGLPLSYRNGPWSGRVHYFHQSSHLGEQFQLLSKPDQPVERTNTSFEALEVLAAYEWNGLQLSGGPAFIVHAATPLKTYNIQAGLDYQSKPVIGNSGSMFGSLFCHWWDETNWHIDVSLRGGINFRSPYSEKRAIQLFGEYFNGHLPFGQFYKAKAEYYGAGIGFSF